MTFYHATCEEGLKELKPFLSEHGKPYVYFSTNPLIALLYAVKPVPKPFSYYPYGFDKNGNIVYSEYYENAFYDLYKGKSGYLYECDDLKDVEMPTQIGHVYTSDKPVKIDRVTRIPDLYVFYKEYENKGEFIVKQRSEVSDKEMNSVFEELKKEIETNNLKQIPDHAMSIFIKEHFPAVWEAAKG